MNRLLAHDGVAPRSAMIKLNAEGGRRFARGLRARISYFGWT
jgi:hypothetical protein